MQMVYVTHLLGLPFIFQFQNQFEEWAQNVRPPSSILQEDEVQVLEHVWNLPAKLVAGLLIRVLTEPE